MYWEKDIETIERKKLDELQLTRLKNTLAKAGKSFYYGKKFKEQKIDAGAVKSLRDIQKIPFTTKDDLRENWPYGLVASHKDDLVRMHSSSGTTGRATVIFHT
ncbi:MAG TPA: phenylacetate--CoA ligase, partial [Smithellaceae bacterium]|nr:phenylacetate--CoA ligase [Smithellaceae bacterium]